MPLHSIILLNRKAPRTVIGLVIQWILHALVTPLILPDLGTPWTLPVQFNLRCTKETPCVVVFLWIPVGQCIQWTLLVVVTLLTPIEIPPGWVIPLTPHVEATPPDKDTLLIPHIKNSCQILSILATECLNTHIQLVVITMVINQMCV